MPKGSARCRANQAYTALHHGEGVWGHDVTRRTREAREEFNQRRNEEVLFLQSRAARIVQEIAKKDKFDLVLYEYFYASDRVDLTRRVIEELDRGVADTEKK